MKPLIPTSALAKIASKPDILFNMEYLAGTYGVEYFNKLRVIWADMFNDHKWVIAELLKYINDDNFLIHLRRITIIASLPDISDAAIVQDMTARLSYVRKALTLWVNGGVISYETKHTPAAISQAGIVMVASVVPHSCALMDVVAYLLYYLQDTFQQRLYLARK
jgi:hypothetical protein